MGGYVEGYLQRPGRAPEHFTRSLSTSVSLAVRVDPRASGIVMKSAGDDGFEVVITPRDRFGNILSPVIVREADDRGRGRELDVEHEDLLDGSHRLTVKLPADARRRGRPILRIAGQTLALGPQREWQTR